MPWPVRRSSRLAFAGRLDNDATTIVVLDDASTGDILLDHALACLPPPGERIALGQALAQVSLRSSELVDGARARLIARGLLARRGDGIFPKAERLQWYSLRNALRRAVLTDELPTPRTVVALGLVEACGLARWVFSADELASRGARLRHVAGLELISQAMTDAIRTFEAAAPEAVASDVESSRCQAPRAVAGGKDAVVSALAHIHSEVGVLRGSLLLSRVNQADGFDCPGCAWPEPYERSLFEFCESGAKAIAAEATSRRADAAFFARTSIDELAHASDYWLERQGRLTEPMLRRSGSTYYEPVSWADALALIAGELRSLPTPDEAVFYVSGRAGNEAAFLVQLLARRLGTNNLPSSANLCHQASAIASSRRSAASRAPLSSPTSRARTLSFCSATTPARTTRACSLRSSGRCGGVPASWQ